MLGLCLLAGALLAGMMAPVALGVGLLSNKISDSVNNVSANLANTDVPLVTTVEDRNGQPIALLFDQYRLPVSFDQISPNMTSAIIAIEDRRFYSHTGVDPRATLRAALSDTAGGSTQGASTITQQFVKNYLVNVVDRNDKAARDADEAQTLARKIREAKMAMQLDQTMSKNDILTGYLNVVAFGDQGAGPFGVGAAAKAYFNTTPDQLTVPQAALLAGMVNNPNLYDPYKHPQNALNRRNDVIDKMVQNGALSAQAAATAKEAPLGVVPGGPTIPSSTCIGAPDYAGFFCDYVISYLEQAGFTADQIFNEGYTIKTTLDPNISQTVKSAVEANVPTTQNGVANTFAVIQPGSTSHDVLAMVANRNYGNDASQGQTMTNIVADASNVFGSGSSFKIFTSAAALETGKAGLNTPLSNPMGQCFPLPGLDPRYNHCYSVQNDGNYANPISLANGLATSPNVAFVNLELQVGMPNVIQMAERLGLRNTLQTNAGDGGAPITDPNDPRSGQSIYSEPQSEYYQHYPSFTLGDSPVSPLEMANVSATLMSGGVWCPANPILSVTDRYGKPIQVNQLPCQQVVSPAVANTLMNGLSQDTVKGTSASAAHAAGWHHADIGKTGTTQLSESVAFVGGVDNYSVASMVFADGTHPHELCPGPPVTLGNCGHGAFGGTVAAPPYFHAFSQILGSTPDTPIPPADPSMQQAGTRGPIVPYVVGQQGDTAAQALQQAGYQVVTQPFNSTAPVGQVVAQTPQGNVATGTQITLYVSTAVLPAPRNSLPPANSTAPGSGVPASGGPPAPGDQPGEPARASG